MHIETERKKRRCLCALSAGVALALSPVAVALCVRKSTRVTAVLGGLVAALGCLFTSFATQFHQLFFSYGPLCAYKAGVEVHTLTQFAASASLIYPTKPKQPPVRPPHAIQILIKTVSGLRSKSYRNRPARLIDCFIRE
ncbi:hypothetical protein EVAR_41240_1 [Eumeta japonica]|uniref:Uncharacterized protein n=1 Tax=Eumeta variegata TaxID=151549 RepID=A0A4C1W3P1_EUMVA|nr:hypothetical protein EVAR_41240_1 [Eumeta japonica]